MQDVVRRGVAPYLFVCPLEVFRELELLFSGKSSLPSIMEVEVPPYIPVPRCQAPQRVHRPWKGCSGCEKSKVKGKKGGGNGASSGFSFCPEFGLQCNASSAPSEPRVTSVALQCCSLRELLHVLERACVYAVNRLRDVRFYGASVCCVCCALPSHPSIDLTKPHFPRCCAHVERQLSTSIKPTLCSAEYQSHSAKTTSQ